MIGRGLLSESGLPTLCAPSIGMSSTSSALSYLSITESRTEKNQIVPSVMAFEPDYMFLSILISFVIDCS